MKLRKIKREAMKAELKGMDGRTKKARKLQRMWTLVNTQAGRSFDVAYEMMSSLIRENNEWGVALDSQAAKVAAECGGRRKVDNEGWWSLDGFVDRFTLQLATA